jgi:uncharacterized protein YjbJ (UPF0337 family)
MERPRDEEDRTVTHHEHEHEQKDEGKRSFEARTEDFQGRVKKAAGELFDDEELRQEGRIDQLSSTVRDTLNGLVDRAKEFVSDTTSRSDTEDR